MASQEGNEDKYEYVYVFTGGGEHWEAEYHYSGTEILGEEDGRLSYSNEYSADFVLTYKGTVEELASLESLEFSYDASAGSGSDKRKFHEPPTEVTFESATTGGSGAKIHDDEMIQVHVKWNDDEETFELQNENS